MRQKTYASSGKFHFFAALLFKPEQSAITEARVRGCLDPDPFLELAYLSVLAAKRAIADYLERFSLSRKKKLYLET